MHDLEHMSLICIKVKYLLEVEGECLRHVMLVLYKHPFFLWVMFRYCILLVIPDNFFAIRPVITMKNGPLFARSSDSRNCSALSSRSVTVKEVYI